MSYRLVDMQCVLEQRGGTLLWKIGFASSHGEVGQGGGRGGTGHTPRAHFFPWLQQMKKWRIWTRFPFWVPASSLPPPAPPPSLNSFQQAIRSSCGAYSQAARNKQQSQGCLRNGVKEEPSPYPGSLRLETHSHQGLNPHATTHKRMTLCKLTDLSELHFS